MHVYAKNPNMLVCFLATLTQALTFYNQPQSSLTGVDPKNTIETKRPKARLRGKDIVCSIPCVQGTMSIHLHSSADGWEKSLVAPSPSINKN